MPDNEEKQEPQSEAEGIPASEPSDAAGLRARNAELAELVEQRDQIIKKLSNELAHEREQRAAQQ